MCDNCTQSTTESTISPLEDTPTWKSKAFPGRHALGGTAEKLATFLNENNVTNFTVVKQTQSSVEIVYKEG
jgi:hypothetical protein